MTTHDEQAFLNAIVAAPDDDTPRLVFADWLDERGTDDDRARAALIRAQCRIEVLPKGNKERKKLEREAKAILKANELKWTAELRAAKLGTKWTFRRGFLDGGTMSPTSFVEKGADLFRLAPTLRAMTFPNAANEVTELAASPYLERLASVDLTLMCTCGWCGIDEELRDLFKSKNAANLRCLNVSRDRIDLGVAGALARAKVLTNLTELNLSDNPFEPEGGAALAKSKHLSNLTSLNLSRTNRQSEGTRAIATAMQFTTLTALYLSGNTIDADGVAALVAAPWFDGLKELDLSANPITEQGAKALATVNENLDQLDLRATGLGKRATAHLKSAFGTRVKLA